MVRRRKPFLTQIFSIFGFTNRRKYAFIHSSWEVIKARKTGTTHTVVDYVVYRLFYSLALSGFGVYLLTHSNPLMHLLYFETWIFFIHMLYSFAFLRQVLAHNHHMKPLGRRQKQPEQIEITDEIERDGHKYYISKRQSILPTSKLSAYEQLVWFLFTISSTLSLLVLVSGEDRLNLIAKKTLNVNLKRFMAEEVGFLMSLIDLFSNTIPMQYGHVIYPLTFACGYFCIEYIYKAYAEDALYKTKLWSFPLCLEILGCILVCHFVIVMLSYLRDFLISLLDKSRNQSTQQRLRTQKRNARRKIMRYVTDSNGKVLRIILEHLTVSQEDVVCWKKKHPEEGDADEADWAGDSKTSLEQQNINPVGSSGEIIQSNEVTNDPPPLRYAPKSQGSTELEEVMVISSVSPDNNITKQIPPIKTVLNDSADELVEIRHTTTKVTPPITKINTTVMPAYTELPHKPPVRNKHPKFKHPMDHDHPKPTEIRNSLKKPTDIRNSLEKPTEIRNSLKKPTEIRNSLKKTTEIRNSLKKPTDIRNSLKKPTEIRNSLKKPNDPNVLSLKRKLSKQGVPVSNGTHKDEGLNDLDDIESPLMKALTREFRSKARGSSTEKGRPRIETDDPQNPGHHIPLSSVDPELRHEHKTYIKQHNDHLLDRLTYHNTFSKTLNLSAPNHPIQIHADPVKKVLYKTPQVTKGILKKSKTHRKSKDSGNRQSQDSTYRKSKDSTNQKSQDSMQRNSKDSTNRKSKDPKNRKSKDSSNSRSKERKGEKLVSKRRERIRMGTDVDPVYDPMVVPNIPNSNSTIYYLDAKLELRGDEAKVPLDHIPAFHKHTGVHIQRQRSSEDHPKKKSIRRSHQTHETHNKAFITGLLKQKEDNHNKRHQLAIPEEESTVAFHPLVQYYDVLIKGDQDMTEGEKDKNDKPNGEKADKEKTDHLLNHKDKHGAK